MEPEEQEGEGEEEGEDGDQSDRITQRLLNIMAGFLEGEVSRYPTGSGDEVG